MSIQEVSPEQLAELFHHYHQALAPDSRCESSLRIEPWEAVSQQERKRMITAARLVLLELSTTPVEEHDAKRYFARPGEAEWGA